ncbi:MAG: DUF3137 domain-containing protein [Oligoflexia bacterium]|nr:DUF3137 domain-containing protein [Oligoflexia bacterium]
MLATKTELRKVYHSRALPLIKKYTEERKKYYFYLFYYYLGLGIIGFLIFKSVPMDLEDFLHTSVGGIVLVGMIFRYFHWRPFRKKFKKNIIKRILGDVFPEFNYKTKGELSSSEFTSSCLYHSSVNIYSCEDQLDGKIEKTDFKFYEVDAKYKTSGKNSSTRTVFFGFIVEVDFNKYFNGHTVIHNDVTVGVFGKWLGEKLNSLNLSSLKKVSLENVVFEKYFHVLSSDSQEARYLLSPKLMEKILKLRERNKGVRLSFYKNRLYISFPQKKNFFEPKFTGELFPLKDLWEINKVISFIPELVETLDLNTRIWTKE